MKLPEVAPQHSDANTTRVLPQQESTDFFFETTHGGGSAMPGKKRSLKALWITLGVIVGLLVAAYVGFAVYFMSHFTFNTTINGFDASLKTSDEIDAQLASDIGSYTLQIEGRDQNAVVKGTDVGLFYLADGEVEAILAGQNEWLWPLSFLPENKQEIEHVSVQYDEQMLSTYLGSLPLMNVEQMITPIDSYLTFEGNQYVIAPGNEGTTLNPEEVTKAVGEALIAGVTTLNLDEEGLYARPEVTSDDGQLTADRDLFNQFVPFQIVYTVGEDRLVLDGYTTINWVDTNTGALSDDAVWAWIAELAGRYDTLGKERTFLNGYGEEKSVAAHDGTYGWQVDQDAEYWAIRNAFEQHLGEEREPHWSSWAASHEAADWGGTYLEVDLSHQHMWYFVDGVCVLETDVVTGNPNTGYETPQGVWYIFSKSYNVVTRGDPLPGGGYEWEVPVDYWMPFTYSGCGFHDANWQPYFGGTRYLTNGSHGCINMPPPLAGDLISVLEPGTPVITHY